MLQFLALPNTNEGDFQRSNMNAYNGQITVGNNIPDSNLYTRHKTHIAKHKPSISCRISKMLIQALIFDSIIESLLPQTKNPSASRSIMPNGYRSPPNMIKVLTLQHTETIQSKFPVQKHNRT